MGYGWPYISAVGDLAVSTILFTNNKVKLPLAVRHMCVDLKLEG